MSIRRLIGGFIVFAVLVASASAATVDEMIAQAGNAATDAERLEILRVLREHPDLESNLAEDVEQLSREVERWMNDPRLEYFGRDILKTDHYDFGIATDSPLFPINCTGRACSPG